MPHIAGIGSPTWRRCRSTDRDRGGHTQGLVPILSGEDTVEKARIQIRTVFVDGRIDLLEKRNADAVIE